MSRRIHIKVVGRLGHAAKVQEGTITIDRGAGLISVRPKHSRTVFCLPLDKVADMICLRVVRANIFQKRLEKAAQRKARRAR